MVFRVYLFIFCILLLQGLPQAALAAAKPLQEPPCPLVPEIRNPEELQKLVNEEHPAAMYCLGERYYKGREVPQNFTLAAKWVSAAAARQYLPAAILYGKILLAGQGVSPDPTSGFQYIRWAAEQGSPEAQATLGSLYEKGLGVKEDPKEAAAWYARAVMYDVPLAFLRLGRMYLEGRGVEQDKGQGTLLLFSAAMKGESEAEEELCKLSQRALDDISIFKDFKIVHASRAAIRAAMKQNRVPLVREEDSYFCDVYNVQAIVPFGKQTFFCYSQNNKENVSFIRIDYATNNTDAAKSALANFTTSFGLPSAQENDYSLLWNFTNVHIVAQYIPMVNQTSLIYIFTNCKQQ